MGGLSQPLLLDRKIDSASTSEDDRKKLKKQRTSLQKHIQKRNVGVYGAVTVRTDGDHMEISFRLEKPRGKQLWQSYHFDHDVNEGWARNTGKGH